MENYNKKWIFTKLYLYMILMGTLWGLASHILWFQMIIGLFEPPMEVLNKIALQVYFLDALIGAISVLPFLYDIKYCVTYTSENKISFFPIAAILSYIIFTVLNTIEVIFILSLTSASYIISVILFKILLASFGVWVPWCLGIRITYPENRTIEVSIAHVIVILVIVLYSIRFIMTY